MTYLASQINEFIFLYRTSPVSFSNVNQKKNCSAVEDNVFLTALHWYAHFEVFVCCLEAQCNSLTEIH